MGKSARLVVAAVFLAVVLLAVAIPTYGKTGELDNLITTADAIVVVEIVSTDYTATAADGPMYAEGKVLKVLKGSISTLGRLRFGETAWWGPTYKDGDLNSTSLQKMPQQEHCP